MKTTSRVILGLALTAFAVTAVSAYAIYNPPRRWFPADMPRTVTVDNRGMASINDGDNGVGQAVIAVERWNGGGAGTIVNAVSGSAVYNTNDGASVVYFGDPLRICTGTCLAATTIGVYNSGQTACCDGLQLVRYTDSDVAFNLSYSYTSEREGDGCSGEFYLEAVTSHEVGHLIGLGHSGTSSALMYPSISSCFNKPLATDDFNGRDAQYDCTSFALGNCGGGGGCTPKGGACSSNAQCCSNKCRGGGCR